MGIFSGLMRACCFAMILLSMTSVTAALPQIRFASLEEGAAELRKEDDFIVRLSAFDRSARMKTSEEVSASAFLSFVGGEVKAWTPDLEASVREAFEPLAPFFGEMKVGPLPEVLLIRTSGLEEGNAAYTRGHCIVLPDSVLEKSPQELTGLLAHELFHILTRADPELRDRLYQSIGFEKCDEVVLPPDLADRRITNPDAPVWAHAIRVKVNGADVKVVPVLVAAVTQYPKDGTEEFFQFLSLRFMRVGTGEGTSATVEPSGMLAVSQLEGFVEQVGRNTGYIIHPEEILADNFKLLATGAENVPSPQILENMRVILIGTR